jgi:hypothetical protein
VPVCAQESRVFLAEDGTPLQLTVPAGRLTDKITALMKPLAQGRAVHLGGRCNYLGERVWVPTCITRTGLVGAARGFTLDELAAYPAYSPASLAYAKLASFLEGHTPTAVLRPLLDASGEFEVGNLRARAIAPPRVAADSKSATRIELIKHCRAVEARAQQALEQAASVAADRVLGQYLLEWSVRVTVTDLKDIPDSLLQAVPVISDPALQMVEFASTALLPETDAFEPPRQPPTTYVPKCEADIMQKASLSKLAAADDAFLTYFRLMRKPGVTEQELIQQRPDPCFFGLNDYLPDARGLV